MLDVGGAFWGLLFILYVWRGAGAGIGAELELFVLERMACFEKDEREFSKEFCSGNFELCFYYCFCQCVSGGFWGGEFDRWGDLYDYDVGFYGQGYDGGPGEASGGAGGGAFVDGCGLVPGEYAESLCRASG